MVIVRSIASSSPPLAITVSGIDDLIPIYRDEAAAVAAVAPAPA
jgi:hypothetical protein